MIPDDLASKLLMAARLNQMFGSPSMNEDDDVNNYYKPRSDISQQYQKSLSEIPQRNNPSKMQRVLGALQALGGSVSPASVYDGQPIGFRYNPKESQEIYDESVHAPYYRKLSDWRVKNEALGKGAAEEDRYNTNQRLLANSIVTRNQNARRLADTAENNRQKRILEERLRDRQDFDAITRRNNSAISKYKAEHPNQQLKVVGDKLGAFDPATGKVEIIKDADGNEIDSGKLDEATKMHIAVQNHLAEIMARGEQQRQTETQKAADVATRQSANITQRAEETRRTNAAKPITGAKSVGNTETTTEQRDAKGNLISTTRRRTTRGNNLGGQPSPTGTVANQPVQQRVKVKGPNGQVGTVTVEDSKKLPAGWVVIP